MQVVEIRTISYFAPQFFMVHLISFFCVYLGLMFPKWVLLGLYSLDNHCSQFHELGNTYLETIINETWWVGKHDGKRKRTLEGGGGGEMAVLIWTLSPPMWVNLGISLRWPPLQVPHLKWKVGLESLWGSYLTFWSMLCHTKDHFLNGHIPAHCAGTPDAVVWRLSV